MVDISKCSRRDCGKRFSCFRYIADSDEYRQSYLVVDKQDVKDGCDMYWRCRDKKELRYMNRVNSL